MSKLKDRIYLVILFLAIISVFLIKFSYVSIGISVISLVLALVFSRKYLRILIVTVIICLSTISTDILIIYNNYNKEVDVFKDKNVIIGTWLYNDYGGRYVFREDYTYTQYSNDNDSDNYCVGKYSYSYGGVSSDGVIIKQDENNYYYDLNLKEDYCIIMGKENYDKFEKEIIFSISKQNNDDVWFMNKESNMPFKLTRIMEN